MLFSVISATTVLAISHLHSTFASPTVSYSPVAASESLNLTHPLSFDAPLDQLCALPSQWSGRTCQPMISDVAWWDTCLIDVTVEPIRVEWKHGLCPMNTICQNTLTAEKVPRQTINCVNRPTGQNDLAPDQEAGVHTVGNKGNGNPVNRSVSVTLQSNFAEATVSAIIEGSDSDYAIAANKPIVAVLRGTIMKLCEYNITNRVCVPTGRFILTAGDIIDFTFGIGGWQVVLFYYAILQVKTHTPVEIAISPPDHSSTFTLDPTIHVATPASSNRPLFVIVLLIVVFFSFFPSLDFQYPAVSQTSTPSKNSVSSVPSNQ